MTGQKVSVVTGGSSGIGRALAVALARRGDTVVAIGRNQDRLDSIEKELRASGHGDALALRLDVGNAGDMAELADTCARKWGRADLLIASAGIGTSEGGGRRLPPATKDLSLTDWQSVVDVNLHGIFLSNTALLPLMRARGSGTIINICSSTTPHGLRGRPLAPAYSATKFAVSAFSRALCEEVAGDGITVSSVFPGSVETPLIANTMLDAPFGGSMTQDSFVAAVLGFAELGHRMELPDPHILPVPGRRANQRQKQ